MTDAPKRRFPFLLTVSVLGNLVLIGLLAGIFLKSPPPRPPGPGGMMGGPGAELSQDERGAVRQLLRDSLAEGRPQVEAARQAERKFVKILTAEPYDEAAARAALDELRAADRLARETVSNRMLDGMDELSAEQRGLVANMMATNLEKRSKRHERFEKFRERRNERRREEDDRP
jgi:hypothetical protein